MGSDWVHNDPKVVIEAEHNAQNYRLEQIKLLAHEKWLAAGEPPGDGVAFWLEAEKEWDKGDHWMAKTIENTKYCEESYNPARFIEHLDMPEANEMCVIVGPKMEIVSETIEAKTRKLDGVWTKTKELTLWQRLLKLFRR